MKSSARAIAFDLDGVLWQSSKIHELAFREAFQECGIATTFEYSIIAGLSTDNAVEAANRMEGAGLTTSELEKIANRKRLLARRMLSESPPVAMGCQFILKELHKKYRLALVSSASSSSVALFIAAAACRPEFDVVVHGDMSVLSKPSPQPYLQAAKIMAIPCDRMIVVEDSISGIESAHIAGVRYVIGVQGTHDDEQLLQSNVICSVKTILDIPKVIDELEDA